jgi:hypothetical protein
MIWVLKLDFGKEKRWKQEHTSPCGHATTGMANVDYSLGRGNSGKHCHDMRILRGRTKITPNKRQLLAHKSFQISSVDLINQQLDVVRDRNYGAPEG